MSLMCSYNRTEKNRTQYKKFGHNSDHFDHDLFFATLMFMHLESSTLSKVKCPANGSSLSNLVTKILIQVLNLLWMD